MAHNLVYKDLSLKEIEEINEIIKDKNKTI
jgi:hypothetical protein